MGRTEARLEIDGGWGQISQSLAGLRKDSGFDLNSKRETLNWIQMD